MWLPRAAQAPHSTMNATLFEHPSGAVVAFVVATAPGCDDAAADRLWRDVAGRSSVEWILSTLASLENISHICLYAPFDHKQTAQAMLARYAGGHAGNFSLTQSRIWASAIVSLRENLPRNPVDYDALVIVDAAMPLVTAESVRAGLQVAQRAGVAIAGEPVKETLKRVSGDRVTQTPDRSALRRLLTPLVFQRETLLHALRRWHDTKAYDADLFAFAQLADKPIAVFDAGYPSLRATTADDLPIIETVLRQRQTEIENA